MRSDLTMILFFLFYDFNPVHTVVAFQINFRIYCT